MVAFLLVLFTLFVLAIVFMVDFKIFTVITMLILVVLLMCFMSILNLKTIQQENQENQVRIDEYKRKIKYARKTYLYDKENLESNLLLIDKQLEEALKTALDIRKFEIELYWKRAGYFWGIMGFCSISTAMAPKFEDGSLVAFFLSCLALFISSGFWMANRGSKFWQENWESHVDILEDEVVGPIYRTVFAKNSGEKLSISDSWPFSVSKINMHISFAFIVFWGIMIAYQFWLISDSMFIMDSSYSVINNLLGFWPFTDKFYFSIIVVLLLSTVLGIAYMYLKTGSSEIEDALMSKKTIVPTKRMMLERPKWYDDL